MSEEHQLIRKTNKQIIPDPILGILLEKLNEGNASILVGAGFSKNARSSDPNITSLPDWAELSSLMVQRYFPSSDYSNKTVLEVASEIEEETGRPELIDIIRDLIPDQSFDPTDVYDGLLKLPWRTIYTTNFDTLLERANQKFKSGYKPILNNTQLSIGQNKSIIKLHGSLENNDMVISKNDYERYSDTHGAFETIFKTSLITDTLCLIGFSGDDPNFIKFFEWKKKSLKENSKQIYLFNIGSIDEGKIEYLNQLDVKVIDITAEVNNNGNTDKQTDYQQLLKLLFSSLAQPIEFAQPLEIESEVIKWPNEDVLSFWAKDGNVRQQMLNIKNQWVSTRTNAPKQFIQDFNNRSRIKDRTIRLEHCLRNLDVLNEFEDLEFLYEFDWRLNVALIPILEDWFETYKKVIDRYKLKIKEDNPCFSKYSIIILSFLRYLRENGKISLFEEYLVLFESYKILDSELRNKKYFEKAIFQLWAFRFDGLDETLNKWIIERDSRWNLNKAFILTQIGRVDESLKLLNVYYKYINTQNNTHQFCRITYELLKFNTRLFSFKNGSAFNFHDGFDDIALPKTNGTLDIYKEINNYGLQHPPLIKENRTTQFNFDLAKTYNFQTSDNAFFFRSISITRLFEDCGVCFKYGDVYSVGLQELQNVIEIYNKYEIYEYQKQIYCLLYGDLKIVDAVYSRKFLSLKSQQSIDEFSVELIDIFYTIESNFHKGEHFKMSSLYSNFYKVLPEILSRLSTKNSFKVLLLILRLFVVLTQSENSKYFENLSKAITRLSKNLPNQKLLEFYKIYLENSFIENGLMSYFDYFKGFIVGENEIEIFKSEAIDKAIIDQLIIRVGGSGLSRANSISALFWLFKLRKLTTYETQSFVTELFSKTDEFKLPISTGYYHFSLLKFDSFLPSDFNSRISRFIYNGDLEIQGQKGNDKNIQLESYFPWVENMIGFASNGFKFSSDQIEFISKRCIGWWSIDSKYLDYDNDGIFGSIKDVFRERFSRMYVLLNQVLGPNLSMLSIENRESLKSIIEEMKSKSFFTIEFELRLDSFKNDNLDDFKIRISKAMNSENNLEVTDALDSIVYLLENNGISETKLIHRASTFLRFRSNEIQNNFYYFFKFMVEKYSTFLNNEILENIDLSLGETLKNSVYTEDDDEEQIVLKVRQKQVGAIMVNTILKHFSEENKRKITSLQDWIEHAKDSLEFSTVRNTLTLFA